MPMTARRSTTAASAKTAANGFAKDNGIDAATVPPTATTLKNTPDRHLRHQAVTIHHRYCINPITDIGCAEILSAFICNTGTSPRAS
jgi:hypothetical protein